MYKFLIEVLRPQFLLLVLMALALIGVWRKRPATRRRLLFLTIPFVLLVLISMPAVTHLALGTLEWPYEPLDQRPTDARAIVVLSGYYGPLDAETGTWHLGEDTLARCLKALELYRASPCPILVTGGNCESNTAGPTCAEAMRDFLVQRGVKKEDILVEACSQSTYENAVESAKLLKARGLDKVVVVTDATHLFRAVRCFRGQGIEVVPCGCRYRTHQFQLTVLAFVPNLSASRRFEVVWHEWVGAGWYWVTGKM
jgi:uncharacterized SAM-binding protein YcdF (DUF218 family)